eukprot:589218-Lingulodinium_polyedra.AAC.1
MPMPQARRSPMNSDCTRRPRCEGHIMATRESLEWATSHPLHWKSVPQDRHSCRPTTAVRPNQCLSEAPSSSKQDSFARPRLNEMNFVARTPQSCDRLALPRQRRHRVAHDDEVSSR